MNSSPQFNLVKKIILGGLIVGLFFFLRGSNVPRSAEYNNQQEITPSSYLGTKKCLIKGNISFKTKEKIYHLPGDAYYDSTVINENYGEHWFCTEAEAKAAGWRHSYW